jgi:hypothetical protein
LDQVTTCEPAWETIRLILASSATRSCVSKHFHALMDRLEYLQKLDLPLDNGRGIHQNRLLQMAREGLRYSTQHLSGFHILKRHATLMAFLIHIYAFLPIVNI